MSGMALVFGLAISCMGTIMRDRRRTVSLAGRILEVVAGSLLFFGTVPLLWGISAATRGFCMIASSAEDPTPEGVREMIQAASPGITVGCIVLLLGAAVMLVAGQVGLRTKPTPSIDTRSTLGLLAAICSVVFGVVASLLFLGVWFHGGGLEAIFTDPSLAPKPSELAGHLAGILNKSLLAFIVVGCQGVTHATAALFAPTPDLEPVSKGLT